MQCKVFLSFARTAHLDCLFLGNSSLKVFHFLVFRLKLSILESISPFFNRILRAQKRYRPPLWKFKKDRKEEDLREALRYQRIVNDTQSKIRQKELKEKMEIADRSGDIRKMKKLLKEVELSKGAREYPSYFS